MAGTDNLSSLVQDLRDVLGIVPAPVPTEPQNSGPDTRPKAGQPWAKKKQQRPKKQWKEAQPPTQPANQSSNQSGNRSANQLAHKPANHPADRLANQPAHQPENQSVQTLVFTRSDPAPGSEPATAVQEKADFDLRSTHDPRSQVHFQSPPRGWTAPENLSSQLREEGSVIQT